jgi:hypothetical protein
MTDPLIWLVISGASLAGLAITAYAGLSGWRGWLELQRLQIERRQDRHSGGDRPAPSPAARIEIADLKERVRKLEAIAAGVDI